VVNGFFFSPNSLKFGEFFPKKKKYVAEFIYFFPQLWKFCTQNKAAPLPY
jgi:hypothetical protein